MILPFTIIRDTREQMPWGFQGIAADKTEQGQQYHVQIEESALRVGDYSIKGCEDRIAVERKSHQDLFGCVGRDRQRFERCVYSLNRLEYPSVVVEADWQQILTIPLPHGQLEPRIVWRTVVSWQLRYPKVHWSFLPSRRLAEVWCFRLLKRFWELDQVRALDGQASVDQS